MAVTISDARIRVTLDTGDAVREAEDLDRELTEREERRDDERDRATERGSERSDPAAPANRDKGGPRFTFTTFPDSPAIDTGVGGGGVVSGGGGGGVPAPGLSIGGGGGRRSGGGRFPMVPASDRVSGVPPGGGDGGFAGLLSLPRIVPIAGSAVVGAGLLAEQFGPAASGFVRGAAEGLDPVTRAIVRRQADNADLLGSAVARLRSATQAFGEARSATTSEAVAQLRLAGRADVDDLTGAAAARFNVASERLRIQRETRAATQRVVGEALGTQAAQILAQGFDMVKAATR